MMGRRAPALTHAETEARRGRRAATGKPFATRSVRPAGPRLSDEEGAALSERIAKRLARAGIASRRDAEALIADGRVKVNGVKLTSPAFNVSASDKIELDGVEIPPIERTRLFLFHKPGGVVTTNRDPGGAPHGVRRAAEGPAAADDHRPARHQHGRPAAAHQ